MRGTGRSKVTAARRLTSFCLVGSALVLAAAAEEPARPEHSAEERATIPCQCRYDGKTFELGEKVCIDGPQGPRIARCDMAQNNTSWTFSDEACVISWRMKRQSIVVARVGPAERLRRVDPLGQ